MPEANSLASLPAHEPNESRPSPGLATDRRPSTWGESILALGLAAWCLAIFVLWVPVYITWPYFTDHDHFGIVAQAWSLGRLPYRDVFSAQFPGEIYLFRILGSLAGWGNSVAFYAVDAAMVGLFGVLLVIWSFRQFGRTLPGFIGLTLFLGYYLSQDNNVAGQRDWHSTFLMMSSFFALGILPSRIGRIASGVAFGLALCIRPQFVLAVPGLFLALDQSSRAPGEAWRKSLRPVVEWSAAAALTFVILFLPLIVNGLMGDFLYRVRMNSYGAGYAPAPFVRLARLTEMIGSRPSLALAPLALLLVAWGSPGRDRRGVLSILAIHCGMLLIGPLSPQTHLYFMIPVVASLGAVCAFLAGTVLTTRPLTGTGRALIFLLIALVAWSRPTHVSRTGIYKSRSGLTLQGTWKEVIEKSYSPGEAIGYLRRGELPILPPSGRFEITVSRPKLRIDPPFKRPAGWDGVTERYPWDDYRAAIEYLRRSTTPETPVASFLFDCATAISSAIARPSPLFIDSFYLKLFEEQLPKNVEALKSPGDRVVVWDPDWDEEFYSKYNPLFHTVREKYRREAAFGHIEIWRRIPEAEGKKAE